MKTTMETRNDNITPWKATHPGTVLKYELDDRGISQKDFAQEIGMQRSHLNELIRGRRAITNPVAYKIEQALGISAVSLLNMQTQYEYDMRAIERRGVEELEARQTLDLYNEIFDVRTLFARLDKMANTATQQLHYLTGTLLLPRPAEMKMEASGMFRKSGKTGNDPRMLMTWKLLAESESMKQTVSHQFDRGRMNIVVDTLVKALHANHSTEHSVKEILSNEGITFCVVEKVEKASVDGYSFVSDGTPHIILTKRYNRIDNFAFALMHEVGHIYLHYTYNASDDGRLSIPDYDNESAEEREANEFASNALIPATEWKTAPKVRLTPTAIQRRYTQWAKEKGLNKWIVLGRIAYETGMYKFHSDENRRIG